MELQQQRKNFMEEENRFKLKQLEEKRALAEEKQEIVR